MLTRGARDLVVTGPVLPCTIDAPLPASDPLVSPASVQQVPVTAAMLIDTGSPVRILRGRLLADLGLTSIGDLNVLTPLGTSPQNVSAYLVNATLPNGELLEDLLVVDAPSQGQHIDGVLGRNVLERGMLMYLGYMNQFTLAF